MNLESYMTSLDLFSCFISSKLRVYLYQNNVKTEEKLSKYLSSHSTIFAKTRNHSNSFAPIHNITKYEMSHLSFEL